MAKRKHAQAKQAPTAKHGCSRCRCHSRVVIVLTKATGRKYNLCPKCFKSRPRRGV